MKKYNAVPILIAFAVAFNTSINAQENQSNSNKSPDASPSLNPFLMLSNALSGKPAEVERLIKEKKFKEADSYVGSEQKFFTENRQSQAELIGKLAVGLNSTYEPMAVELEEAWGQTSSEFPTNEWKKIKTLVLNTEALLDDYGRLNVFQIGGKKSEKISLLEQLYRSKQSDLKMRSVKEFLNYNHFSGNTFFVLYPIKLNEAEFFTSNSQAIRELAGKFSAEEVSKFSKTYGAYIDSKSALQESLSIQFVQSSINENRNGDSIENIYNTVKKAKDQGIPLKAIPGSRMAFVEVTSKSLLSEGQIEFPMQIEMDLPLDPIKTDLDVLTEKVEGVAAEYVVIVDVAASKVNRRILAKEDHESKFITGTRSSPNPEYEIARGKLFEAQAGLSRAQNTYSYGIAGAVLKVAAIALWQGNVTDAERLLSNTPSMVSSNLFDSYKYSTSDVKVTRSLTANYYVINRSSRQYFKGIFDIEESKPFKISYNLHDKDPERGTILSKFATEDDIVAYEKTPMSLKASMLRNLSKTHSASAFGLANFS